MLALLLIKDFRLLKADLTKILLLFAVYILILISNFIVVGSAADDRTHLVHYVLITSFLIAVNLADTTKGPEYSGGMLGIFYKKSGELYTFLLSKILTLTTVSLAQSLVLMITFFIFAPLQALDIILLAAATWMFLIIINLMLLFANHMMALDSSSYYALVVLPFAVPYTLLAINATLVDYSYLWVMAGLILLTAPVIILLTAHLIIRLFSV